MRFFSMFSGIGGFELGIYRAVERITASRKADAADDQPNTQGRHESRGYGAACVGYSEIDKYAIQIYNKHFGEHKNYGDATRIIPEELPDFDLLVGGFPCQAFSIAGKRLGFDDTRGTLFFEIARILKVNRPRMFLLENVKGLLSHDNGRTFKTIISTLTELGYGVEWQVLNSKNFGVPQNRERVFIVGYLGDGCAGKVFPLGESGGLSGGEGESDQRRTQTEVSHTLKGPNMKADQLFIRESQRLPDAMRVRETDGNAVTLKGEGGGQGAKTGLYRTEGMRIRRLTPTECERLQGFPDGWTDGISDSQRYKCLGNAVTVNVIEAIMEELIKNDNS